MPAARYWRLVAFDVENGSDLRLAEIELRGAGTRVDGPATISSSVAPTSGALADLKNSLTTDDVRFAAADVLRPGFEIAWDFGADTLVDEFRLVLPGGAPGVNYCELQYLSAGVWTTETRWLGRFTNATPRVQQYTSSDPSFDSVILQIPHTSTIRGGYDVSKKLLLGVGTNVHYWTNPTWGTKFGPALAFANTSFTVIGSIVFNTQDSITGDFTVEAWFHGINFINGSAFANLLSFGAPPNAWALTYFHTGTNYTLALRNSSGVNVVSHLQSSVSYQWNFVTWTRDSGVHRIYLNGNLVGSFSDNSTISFSQIFLGQTPSTLTAAFMVDGLRVTKGVVRSQSVPSTAFPMLTFPGAVPRSASPAIRISEYTPPAQTSVLAAPRAVTLDLAFGGTYRIVGTVRRQADPVNLPLRRRVRLLNEFGTATVRETWSDATTGAFAFNEIAGPGRYVVVTYDHLNQYRALAADQVWSVPM